MNKSRITKEMALKVAATLVSDNIAAQDDWIKRHEGGDFCLDLSDQEGNYVAIMCFAPVYMNKQSLTRLSPYRDCIRGIRITKDLNCIFHQMFVFIDSAYIIFKKQPDGNLVELPYKCGYDYEEGDSHEFIGGLLLPLPADVKFWVDIGSERIWIDPPKSAFESDYINANQACWMDCTYFDRVMGGGEINEDEMCEDCPIRDLMNRT